MGVIYKLKPEIKEFILKQKIANPQLSCRGLMPLIKDKFQVNISKSLINNIIKKENLSSLVGRRRLKQRAIFEPSALEISKRFQGPGPGDALHFPGQEVLKSLIQSVKDEVSQPLVVNKAEIGAMENGGYFFLKTADLQSGLTFFLAQKLSFFFPNLSVESLQEIIEASMYLPFFKSKTSLWFLIGKELCLENLTRYSQVLAEIPVSPIKESLLKAGFNLNLNSINELHNQCLISLNSYVQANFFPDVYQILGFTAMQERFYSLSAKVENKPGLCKIELFCNPEFQFKNDIIWQEDFSYAVNKVNAVQVFTYGKVQLLINVLPFS
jgi:hypothetical protein